MRNLTIQIDQRRAPGRARFQKFLHNLDLTRRAELH